MNWILFWSAFGYETLNVLAYRAFAYYPFRRQLRFPVWVVALLIGGTQAVQSAIYGYQAANGLSTRMSEMVLALVCMVIYFSCIRADVWKLLFLYIFVVDYVTIVRGAAYFAEARLFYTPDMTFDTLRSALISFAIFAVTVPFMLLFLRKTKDRVFRTDAPMLWRTIWLLPAATTGIVFLFTLRLEAESVRQPRFLFARVLLILGMFVVYYILVQSLAMIREQAALKEKNALQETMLSMQRTQYSQLTRHIEEARQARHDLRQHLTLIHSYLKNENRDALNDYLEQYEQSLPPDVHQTLCKNYAVNTLLSYYQEEARKEGIDFSVKVDFQEKLNINEAELCALFGNLLENALTACREVKRRAPFIKVRGEHKDGHLALTVDNTCETEPISNGEQFLSTSHSGEGIGTASVKAVAGHYNGQVDFRYDDHVFYASVVLFYDEG